MPQINRYPANNNTQPSSANGNLDSISDNSATDLLDDDYVDFQDYNKKGFEKSPAAINSKYSGKGPTSIFDDI